MRIQVARPQGNNQGPDIVESLLTTEQAGIARGTREIDYHCSNRSVERGNCTLLPYMPVGKLMNVTEESGQYRGKLKLYAITIDISENGRQFSATTSIAIEREMR